MKTTKLVNAHILLRCGEELHKDMCGELRDALLSKFDNVKSAQTIKTITGSVDYCVAATAKIDPAMEEKFRKDLSKLQTSAKKSSQVKAIQIDLEIR